jgi:hypothetical protein
MSDIFQTTTDRLRRWSDRAFLALFLAAESSGSLRRVQRELFRAAIRALIWERRRGGHALFEEIRAAMARLGRLRARPLSAKLGIDADNVGDLGRIQDFEDRSYGIEGVWPERGRERAVKHETRCPYADLLRDLPEFCEEIVHGFEVATFRELNPRYRLRVLAGGPLLSRGASHCHFEHDFGGGAS